MEQLREDPDLKPVFDDIAASGTAAMEKYWNDNDLMTRISRKMSEMGISPEPAPQPPGKTLPVRLLAGGTQLDLGSFCSPTYVECDLGHAQWRCICCQRSRVAR